MSLFPLVAWGLVLIADVVVYVLVAKRIEKTNLARLGATGKLFTCVPDEAKLKKELEEIEKIR